MSVSKERENGCVVVSLWLKGLAHFMINMYLFV